MIGSKLRKIRDLKGMGQQELAKAVGCTQQTISNWERNVYEPDASELVELAKILKVSVMDLLAEAEVGGVMSKKTIQGKYAEWGLQAVEAHQQTLPLDDIDGILGIDQEAHKNEFDIVRGAPLWAESIALSGFFPRAFRGLCIRGFDLRVVPNNRTEETKYDMDMRVEWDGAEGPNKMIGLIDPERKTRPNDKIFLDHSTFPINVPLYTFRYNTDKNAQRRFTNKMMHFKAHPDRTFFIAIRHDGQMAFAVKGQDIIEAPIEEIKANGPYVRPLMVHRIPREQAAFCLRDHLDIRFVIKSLYEVGAFDENFSR